MSACRVRRRGCVDRDDTGDAGSRESSRTTSFARFTVRLGVELADQVSPCGSRNQDGRGGQRALGLVRSEAQRRACGVLRGSRTVCRSAMLPRVARLRMLVPLSRSLPPISVVALAPCHGGGAGPAPSRSSGSVMADWYPLLGRLLRPQDGQDPGRGSNLCRRHHECHPPTETPRLASGFARDHGGDGTPVS